MKDFRKQFNKGFPKGILSIYLYIIYMSFVRTLVRNIGHFLWYILSNSIVVFLAVLVFLGDLFLANLYVQNVCFFYYYMPIRNIYILHVTLRLLPRVLWVRKFDPFGYQNLILNYHM